MIHSLNKGTEEGTMEPQSDEQRSKDASAFLVKADRLVKDGDLASAMALILKARTCDPCNQYAVAYEERVQMLVNSNGGDTGKRATLPVSTTKASINVAPKPHHPAPPAIKKNGLDLPSPMSNSFVTTAFTMPPSKPKAVPAKPEDRVKDESRLTAMEAKVAAFLSRASAHLEKKEFNPALDEIARAYLLDPSNKAIHALEEKARCAIAEDQRANDESHREKEEGILKKEREERQQQEYRRTAIEQKHTAFLSRAANYFEQSEFNKALDEIARAYLLDPHNKKTQALEEMVRKAIDVNRQNPAPGETGKGAGNRSADEVTLNHEESRKSAIGQKISAFLSRADTHFENKEFDRALDEVARAYFLDPVNDEIRALEERIRGAQESSHRFEEDRNRQTEEYKHKRNEILRTQMSLGQADHRATPNPKERTSPSFRGLGIEEYLQHVRALVAENRLDEALAELPFVIVLDPFNEEVLQLEQIIVAAKEKQQQRNLQLLQKQLEERKKRRQIIIATIQKHIEDAESFGVQRHHSPDSRLTALRTNSDLSEDEAGDWEKKILATQAALLTSCVS